MESNSVAVEKMVPAVRGRGAVLQKKTGRGLKVEENEKEVHGQWVMRDVERIEPLAPEQKLT